MLGEIKIDKGIPMPAVSSDGGLMETMKKMKVGDSFLYPLKNRSSVTGVGARCGMVFATRKVDDEQVRCWRIK